MANEILPELSPNPESALGYDGTDFRTLAVDTDGQLRVKGEDQLFSYKDQGLIGVAATATASGMTLTTNPVPSGEVWVITNASIGNFTRAAPVASIGIKANGEIKYAAAGGSTAGAGLYFCFNGHLYLEAGNRVYGYVSGCEVDDSITFNINGYKMTKET